jgi:hypothetical protein
MMTCSRRLFLTLSIFFLSNGCTKKSQIAIETDVKQASMASRSSQSNQVAVVSTSAEPFEAFDIAQEAIAQGAKYILFPEWGFLTDAVAATSTSLDEWALLAKDKAAYIILGARFNARNTVFLFSPDGTRKSLVRRDGYNSPKPTLQSELSPFTFVTPDGKFGILICDESRTQTFFDEMKSQGIDALFVPNYAGLAVFDDTLDRRYKSFSADFDRFIADKLPSMKGGTETHVVRGKTKKYELNAFGKDMVVGEAPETKISKNGTTYSISYHALKP